MRMEYVVVGFVILLIVLLVSLTVLGNAADLFGEIGKMLR